MKQDDIIRELGSVILMQEKEIEKLRSKITRVKQYLEVYEEYIENNK